MHRNNKRPLAIVFGTFVIIIGICVVFVLNIKDILATRPPEFSKTNMLEALWHQYKANYLEWGTLRSLDKQQESVTTSEGQSYTMLRAVWMDDKETFDTAWQWTKDNLQRDEDLLMSWLFGKLEDGSYGILTEKGGYNTATDADQDIALALLFASKRWNDPRYFGDAIGIIRDIWDKEVIFIENRPYLVANDIEPTAPKAKVVVNPSYLSPYTYKVFSEVDPDHDWLGLAATSYEVAGRSIEMELDKSTSAHLPPDWILMDKETGDIFAAPSETRLTTNFSFDALRLPWRFALDYLITKDPRAKEVLDKIGHIGGEWESRRSIAATYSHDGVRLINHGAPSMYGGVLGYFMVTDPTIAQEIYTEKLESLYDTNESKWKSPQSYYDENWAWFGMALYAGESIDLFNLKK